METVLNEKEVRVLGSLMEKAMATPEYYPLSLNALTNACNQKSNRDPVVAWNEPTVAEAADQLESKGLVHLSTTGRVPKYEETFTRQHNMVSSEAAALCVLLLRGAQTPGAIRSRCERLYTFESLEDLHETLERLREWGHVARLERLPGHKEARYVHLLGGTAGSPAPDADLPESRRPAEADDRLERLEARIDALRDELFDLRSAFESFRKQFE